MKCEAYVILARTQRLVDDCDSYRWLESCYSKRFVQLIRSFTLSARCVIMSVGGDRCVFLCVLSEPLMLPSRAIGNFLFPTCEVWLWACRIRALMSERIKCSIPLVDNHINIHRATHAVCWQFWNFGQIHAYFFAYKTYNMLRMIVHI